MSGRWDGWKNKKEKGGMAIHKGMRVRAVKEGLPEAKTCVNGAKRNLPVQKRVSVMNLLPARAATLARKIESEARLQLMNENLPPCGSRILMRQFHIRSNSLRTNCV